MHQDQTNHNETPIPPAIKPHSSKLRGSRPRRKGPRDILGALSSLFLFILFPAIIAIFLTAFVVQSYQVDGPSMENSLHDGDRLVVAKLPRTWSRLTHHQYVPARGDIIIFNQTGLPDAFFQKQLIKRVVGLPGERISVRNGQVTVYNDASSAGFNPDNQGSYTIDALTTSGSREWIVASNEVFVLGDNRANSEDSRYFGPIKTNAIVGKLMLRIYPFNKTEVF